MTAVREDGIWNSRLTFASVAVVCVIYASSRFWGLTDACLWFDEIFSVHAAGHSWGEILNFVALDLIHPPLFYIMLKLWIGIGGESLFWLRLFPVIWSVLAIVPFFGLCREMRLRWPTQIFAFFLIATNGSLIKYAQEVRMYAPLMCIALFSTWLFARYFFRGKGIVALVVVNVLIVYTHYFGWFVVAAEMVLILWLQRLKWRQSLAMFGVVFAAFVPWLIAVTAAAQNGSALGQNIGWMSRPGMREVVTFALGLVEPFYFRTITAEPLSRFAISLPMLAVVVIAVMVFLFAGKRSEGDERNLYFRIAFVMVPVIAAFFASWVLPYSVWGTRHLIAVFVPAAILISMAVMSMPFRSWRIASISSMVLLTATGFIVQASNPHPSPPWCAFGTVANEALAVEKANVYVTEDLTAYQTWFALRESSYVAVLKLANIDGIAEDKAYFLPRGFDVVKTIDVADVNEARLWLIYRAPELKESEPPIRNLTVGGYRIVTKNVRVTDSGDVIAVLFEK